MSEFIEKEIYKILEKHPQTTKSLSKLLQAEFKKFNLFKSSSRVLSLLKKMHADGKIERSDRQHKGGITWGLKE